MSDQSFLERMNIIESSIRQAHSDILDGKHTDMMPLHNLIEKLSRDLGNNAEEFTLNSREEFTAQLETLTNELSELEYLLSDLITEEPGGFTAGMPQQEVSDVSSSTLTQKIALWDGFPLKSL